MKIVRLILLTIVFISSFIINCAEASISNLDDNIIATPCNIRLDEENWQTPLSDHILEIAKYAGWASTAYTFATTPITYSLIVKTGWEEYRGGLLSGLLDYMSTELSYGLYDEFGNHFTSDWDVAIAGSAYTYQGTVYPYINILMPDATWIDRQDVTFRITTDCGLNPLCNDDVVMKQRTISFMRKGSNESLIYPTLYVDESGMGSATISDGVDLPPGKYKLKISINGDSYPSVRFEIKPNPYIVSISPSEDGKATRDTVITIALNNHIDFSMFDNKYISISGDSSGIHSYSSSYDPSTAVITLIPDSPFDYGEEIEIAISTAGIVDSDGNNLVLPSLALNQMDNEVGAWHYYYPTIEDKPTALLNINKTGEGTGTVISTPPGIYCGDDCSEGFDEGDTVTLTAVENGDSTFSGWFGGGCSGTGTCTITITEDTTVTAIFDLKEPIETDDPITVISPNGGELLIPGHTYRIKWNKNEENLTTVRIELVDIYGGLYTQAIKENAQWDYYDWVVPDDYQNGQYKVRITSINTPSHYDESDNFFTIIEEPLIHLSSPTGGQIFSLGDTVPIRWLPEGDTGEYVEIKWLNQSDGADPDIGTIVSTTLNDGAYNWIVPNNIGQGNEFEIKIKSIQYSYYDYSDEFSIIDPPEQAINPSPELNASNVSLEFVLSWENGGGAESYNVYFGTTPYLSNSQYKGNQEDTVFNPGLLENDTIYYWRIDARNRLGVYTGATWTFKTEKRLVKGDLNTDFMVTFRDAVLGFNIITSQENSVNITSDVNGDGKIGLIDEIYIIQQATNINSLVNFIDFNINTAEPVLLVEPCPVTVNYSYKNDSDQTVYVHLTGTGIDSSLGISMIPPKTEGLGSYSFGKSDVGMISNMVLKMSNANVAGKTIAEQIIPGEIEFILP